MCGGGNTGSRIAPTFTRYQNLSTRFFESYILGFTYFGNRLLKASIGMLLSCQLISFVRQMNLISKHFDAKNVTRINIWKLVYIF